MSSTTIVLYKASFGFALAPISKASQQTQCKFKRQRLPAIHFSFHPRKNNQPRFYRTSKNRKRMFRSNFFIVFSYILLHFVCFYFVCLLFFRLFPFFVCDFFFSCSFSISIRWLSLLIRFFFWVSIFRQMYLRSFVCCQLW